MTLRVSTTVGAVLDEHGGSIQTGPFGTRLKASEYTASGVPVISVAEVGYGRISAHPKTPRVDTNVTDRLPEYLLCAGDIVFGRKGAKIDKSAIVRPCQDGWFLGSDGIRLRLPEICDRDFIAYQLLTQSHRAWMFQHAAGSTMPSLNEGIIRRIPLVLLPLGQQRAIASVLRSLDDKIELNRRMNRTLEQMAAAIFKAWFVDFEPIRAKASGAGSFPGMPQPVFNALPATFADSELGPIPEGWEVKPFSDCVTIWSGGTPKRSEPSYWGGDVPWYSVKDAPSESDAWIIDTSEKITKAGLDGSAAKLLPVGTTIISARGTVGTLALTAVPMAMNQSCYGLEGVDGAGAYLTYWRTRRAVDVLRQRSHGSVFDTITRDTFEGVPIVTAPPSWLAAFDAAVSSLMELIRQNGVESRTLAETRDVLLPKLLSGEVRLPPTGGGVIDDGSKPSTAQILAMACVADDLESAAIPRWPESQRLGGGQVVMPILDNGPAIDRFEQQAYESGLVIDFDWPEWQKQAAHYFADHARLAEADLDTLQRLVTTCVRQERFCEGTLADLHAGGSLLAICRRLGQIAKERDR